MKKYNDQCGRAILNDEGILELIRRNQSLDGIIVEDSEEVQQYNAHSQNKLIIYNDEMKAQSKEEFDWINTHVWMTPSEYTNINLHKYLIDKCKTEIERNRVEYELSLYQELDLEPLLRHLIYLINHFRKNNIVWGVGRGSSVSSYILFLIGVHKVDSIKYHLDINEFLKI